MSHTIPAIVGIGGSWQSSLVATAMTTTFPTSAPSANTRPITFAVGTVVRVQHNTNLVKIHSHAAWSDDDHQTPR